MLEADFVQVSADQVISRSILGVFYAYYPISITIWWVGVMAFVFRFMALLNIAIVYWILKSV